MIFMGPHEQTYFILYSQHVLKPRYRAHAPKINSSPYVLQSQSNVTVDHKLCLCILEAQIF